MGILELINVAINKVIIAIRIPRHGVVKLQTICMVWLI
jgi:hypothetical protein